jgi:hypothetical protein
VSWNYVCSEIAAADFLFQIVDLLLQVVVSSGIQDAKIANLNLIDNCDV